MVTVGSRDADGNYRSERKWYLTAPYKRGARIEATPEQLDLSSNCRSRTRRHNLYKPGIRQAAEQPKHE